MSKNALMSIAGLIFLSTIRNGSRNEIDFYDHLRMGGLVDTGRTPEVGTIAPDEDAFIIKFNRDRCGVVVKIVPKLVGTYYLSSIKVVGDQSCYRKGYANEVLKIICHAADESKTNLLIFPAPFGDIEDGPTVSQLKSWYSDWGFEPLSKDTGESIFMIRKTTGVSGSMGRIRMGNKDANHLKQIFRNLKDHQSEVLRPFYEGKISLMDAMNLVLSNPYTYHSEEYDSSVSLIYLGDRMLRNNFIFFHNPAMYKPSNIWLAGPSKGAPKTRGDKVRLISIVRKLGKIIKDSSNLPPGSPEFFYDPSLTESENEKKYLSILIKYLSGLMPNDNLKLDVALILFEEPNVNPQFRSVADGHIYFYDETSLVRSFRHEVRHSLDYEFKSKRRNFDPRRYSVHSLKRNRREQLGDLQEPRNYRNMPHPERPAELETYIGDVYDQIRYSDAWSDKSGSFLATPRAGGVVSRITNDDLKTISYCMVNLYGRRNNSGIPSEILLEIMTKLISEAYRVHFLSKKDKFFSQDYFNMMRVELLSSAYQAGREIYNHFEDWFIANFDPFIIETTGVSGSMSRPIYDSPRLEERFKEKGWLQR